jgi:hypothetical protein
MRPKRPNPLFANFAIRVAALFIDFVLVIFIATAFNGHVLMPVMSRD